MQGYPQIHVTTKYQEFLKALTSVGKPAMVDQVYIKKLGFKSSYDANFLGAVKYIGLVEDKRNGSPTDLWGKLRVNFAKALAEGLTAGYADLFSFYPDAHLRDEEALANFFRGNSDGDADAVGRMVNAFVAVRELADFSDAKNGEGGDSQPNNSTENEEETIVEKEEQSTNEGKSQINLNIQLQLPSDASGEVYDKFFAAMKKHGLI